MGVGGIPGPVRQYVSGLCAATLGLCAAGWLALAPVAFGYRSARTGSALPGSALPGSALPGSALHRALLADWATGAALAVVSLATLLAWVVAWRRKLRADGVVAPSSRRQAWREARAQRRQERDGVRAADVAEPATGSPDPARVLSELRALLIPLLDEPPAGEEAVHEERAHEEPAHQEAIHEEPVPGEPVPAEARSEVPARDGAARDEPASPASAVPPPRPGGLAAMESMLAGAELLMVACGEEEAW
jgi:hypothetical protein